MVMIISLTAQVRVVVHAAFLQQTRKVQMVMEVRGDRRAHEIHIGTKAMAVQRVRPSQALRSQA